MTADAVHRQILMDLADAALDRQARMRDTPRARRARAALEAADDDDIRARFHDADRDRAEPRDRRHLYRDDRRGMHFAQIGDELRQVFYAVNIMMRRRTDEIDAGCRLADARDLRVHLGAGQMAAFTRFCALPDLDLNLVCINEVRGIDAEAPRCNLANLAARALVHAAPIAFNIFAALAAVRARAKMIKCGGDRAMGGSPKRAVRHRRAAYRRANNLMRRRYPVARDARAPRRQFKHVAQIHRRRIVEKLGEAIVRALRIPFARSARERFDHFLTIDGNVAIASQFVARPRRARHDIRIDIVDGDTTETRNRIGDVILHHLGLRQLFLDEVGQLQ